MVALGRLRKSKTPTVFESPIADDNLPPQSSVCQQLFTAPTPRNFSYPIGISTGSRTQNCPHTSNRESSNCGQVCEVFSPSLHSCSKGRTWSEETSFFKGGQHPHAQPHKHEGKFAIQRQLDQLDLNKPSKERESTRKKQRRSTLLSLSASYTRSTTSIGDILEAKETKEPSYNPNKASKVFSFGDYTLPPKPPRFKRTSLIQHKTASSFDASQLVRVYTTSPHRPASSSQTCAPPAKAPEPALEAFPSYAWEHIGGDSIPRSQLTEHHPAPKLSKMGPNDNKVAAADRRPSNGGRSRGNSTSEVDKRKGKEGKGRWLTQLKEWVSVSEPSTQAFKQHRKGTYQRAGIALDDPRAGAKLHIPTTTLPSNAIKPSGRGPEPEEVAKRNTDNKKRIRQSFSTTGGTSQGSRSSTSQHSSMSSLPMHCYPREDA
ncbi:hypothetical protein PG994_010883 [Apiospora phragmitis]|uniref:Uncharacterized protein n=1 Tax=Apiospora phragmitis TaxID=2905665 RepID=A0ABR1TR82_9PEZI